MPELALTTSAAYHGSPIHDGFATIRAPRSRIKIRNLVDPNPITNLPQRHSEYFTLNSTPKNNFLDNCEVQYVVQAPTKNIFEEKPSRLSFTEPIYAKISPPQSQRNSPVKHSSSRQETHYDSINTKPRRRLRSLELPGEQDARASEKIGIANLGNGERFSHDQHVTGIQDGAEQHSVRTDVTSSSGDFKRSHSDRDNCSESSSYLTDNDRPISSYSDNSTIPSTDTEDVLKDLPNKSKFHRSPQKFATLNLRRPKFIDLKPTNIKENSSYQSTHRNRIGYYSEPNTPLNGEHSGFGDDPSILSEVQQIPKMPLQNNRKSFTRSVSENGFSKRLNYRHSFSADFRAQAQPGLGSKKPHKCCECVTGVSADETPEDSSRPSSRTLGTLYESQDPKVGCQTILRAKPPVPWWDLAIRKSRYKSCPILEEVRRFTLSKLSTVIWKYLHRFQRVHFHLRCGVSFPCK